MPTTSGNPTRAERRAARRRSIYLGRIAAAAGPRAKANAVVGWWMAEWYRLDDERQATEFARIRALVEAMNRDGGDDGE